MREVFERLEAMAIPYFLTGSEALARYGQPRQTMDVDIVVGITTRDFDRLARAFDEDFVVNQPIQGSIQSMASLVATSALGKVDLMFGRDDAWSRSAIARRERWEHPEFGWLWVVSLEDSFWPSWSGGLGSRSFKRGTAATSSSPTWSTSIGAIWNDGRASWVSRSRYVEREMRADTGQGLLDQRIAHSTIEERLTWVAAKRATAIRSLWQQVDAAGITDPVEQARFLLARLYPEMPKEWFEATLAALGERHAQGRWHGYERP